MSNSSQKVSLAEKIGYSLGELAANLVFRLFCWLSELYCLGKSQIEKEKVAVWNDVITPVKVRYTWAHNL